MSDQSPQVPGPVQLPQPQPFHEFPWEEVARVLLKAKGITSGLWHVGLRLQFAATAVGPTPTELLPGAIVGVQTVTLTQVDQPGPLVYDARVLSRRRKSSSAGTK